MQHFTRLCFSADWIQPVSGAASTHFSSTYNVENIWDRSLGRSAGGWGCYYSAVISGANNFHWVDLNLGNFYLVTAVSFLAAPCDVHCGECMGSLLLKRAKLVFFTTTKEF